MKKICITCGSEFESDNFQQKTCSYECRKKKIKRVKLHKICPGCKKEFETTKKNKIYCFQSCKKKQKPRLTYEEYKKRKNLYNKEYRKTEKGKLSMFKYHSKRRLKFPIKLEAEQMEFIKQRDQMRCVYCGCKVLENVEKFHPQKLTFDHINPNGPTNTENIVIACRACNISKGKKEVFEFCNERGFSIPNIVKCDSLAIRSNVYLYVR